MGFRRWLARIVGIDNRMRQQATEGVEMVKIGLAMYLLLLPVGVTMRVFRRDLLDRGRSPDAESYLVPVMRQTTLDTLPDIF